MGAKLVFSAWDTFIFTIPFLGFLAMVMFGLDERFAAPRKRPRTRRIFCEAEGKGRAFLTDPDGRPWQDSSIPEIEGEVHPGMFSATE